MKSRVLYFPYIRVHIEKLDGIADALVRQRLAAPGRYPWYDVEPDTAEDFMSYLAASLGDGADRTLGDRGTSRCFFTSWTCRCIVGRDLGRKPAADPSRFCVRRPCTSRAGGNRLREHHAGMGTPSLPAYGCQTRARECERHGPSERGRLNADVTTRRKSSPLGPS